MAYPLENLFRRPAEIYSSISALGACGLLWTHPSYFLVTPATGGIFTVGMVGLAAWRGNQARYVMRFQRNLRRLPVYELSASQVPSSAKEVFLGMGFYWEPHHTQRLYMARQTENIRLRARNGWYQRARDFERRFPSNAVSRFTRSDAWYNPVAPLAPVGGDPALHGIEPNEYQIWSPVAERVGHMLVLGTTRVGKTRFCEVLVTQDIRRGDVVIVFDPKGDVDLLLKMYQEAKRCGRENAFYFFHLGYPEVSARYSPIGSFARITEVATRIAGQLPSEGQSAAFREFVWRFVNVMARAMTALGMKPTYEMVYQNATNIDGLALRYLEFWLDRDHPDWADMLPEPGKDVVERAKKTGRSLHTMQILSLMQEKNWHEPVADGLASVLANDRTYFEKLVSSLYPLLEKLTTGKTAELLSPEYDDPLDPRPAFDWSQIIDRGGIVYVGLDALSDFEVAGAVGNAMFADLTSTAGRIYKYGSGYGQGAAVPKRNLSIHADEFNELVGDEFIPMVNKAGGAGYQVTAYTQTISDIEAKIGSKAKASQIEGNFNTLVMLRVKNPETAEVLTNQLDEVEIKMLRPSTSATDGTKADGTHFTSQTADQLATRVVPRIQTADIIQLPKGQAFALIEGGQLVKLRMPLAKSDAGDASLPNLASIVSDMRRRYDGYRIAEDSEVSDVEAESGTPLWTRGASQHHIAGVTSDGKGASL
ncbi:type IV conjugative transfer system coupling protein TraD [Robbsia andropogonis]|uniref:type IV conjugative transfer system coupling protein TraD n=1 Tax=Robbsia andropogonis TaxID=28092 RepID=UPI00158D33B9|nr:type IV conjugative transfer system coupling protein TraD [Robbsia andropogonis]